MFALLLVTTLLGAADDRADQIADALMQALGGRENWEHARFIRFVNVRHNRRTTFTWDRFEGRLRIDARNASGVPYVVLMNLHARQGRVFVEGRPLRGTELSEYLKRAERMWTGATYWFLMPFKWKDPGVRLSYQGEETVDGVLYDVVHLSFEGVGLTPGDQYWAYVNRETHLMDRFRFELESGAKGDYRWGRWHRHKGLLFATERRSDDEVIRFEDIAVAESMPHALFTDPEATEFP